MTVLVIDDHRLVGTSLVLALRGHALDARSATGRTLAALLDEAAALPPGLVLLDLDLGRGDDGTELDGVELVAPLCAAGWTVLVVTGTSDRSRVAAAVCRGAVGWVAKSAPFEDLVRAAVDAAAGFPVLAPAERAELVALHRRTVADRTGRPADRDRLLDRLTPRELEVLRALAEGKRARAIAEESWVALSTVRSQIRAILTKLEVNSQLQAAALGRELLAPRRDRD
ncbi:response regulator transcription factor [Peterkaempfera bronchialis]|uniref:DNA-binding response regulator n=1 Tax=Peterkaempfera bronchialis TaxID=2126346 RepID=A0A345T0L2_9ACTN|nr:response regulator transcription factor [Peterkaempfera bronchialis]AXI79517.1 DNA-binding response regulator [Peterkaempfera bronchialis]